MRIGITGSHGTGKTTLALHISRALGVFMITEQARKVARQMVIPSCVVLGNNHLTVDFQQRVLLAQIAAEVGSNWVSDRTTLDCLAYWELYGLTGLPETQLYADKCLNNMGRYDLVVYVPVEVRAKPDGFRLSDDKSQTFVDSVIREYLNGIPHITVSGTPEERLNQVLRIVIESYMHPAKAGGFSRHFGD